MVDTASVNFVPSTSMGFESGVVSTTAFQPAMGSTLTSAIGLLVGNVICTLVVAESSRSFGTWKAKVAASPGAMVPGMTATCAYAGAAMANEPATSAAAVTMREMGTRMWFLFGRGQTRGRDGPDGLLRSGSETTSASWTSVDVMLAVTERRDHVGRAASTHTSTMPTISSRCCAS